MTSRKARRKAAYRAWCEEHSVEQAATMSAAAVMLGTMPDPPFLILVMVRMVQRVAADLATAVTRPPDEHL